MKSIRVAVVGAGMAGQAHAFGWRNASMAVDLEPVRVELACVVDPRTDLAQVVRDRYGFAAAETDIGAVLRDTSIDVVSVALPNHLHAQLLPRVLDAGKHLFAEKPLGRGVPEARALADRARSSGLVVGMGFSFRRLPGLAAMAECVASGAIGEVRHARAWYYADYAADPAAAFSWRYSKADAGGGAILDIGAHAIDALQFVAGEISEVTAAELTTVITKRPVPTTDRDSNGDDAGALRAVDNDDAAVLIGRLAGGGLAHVDVSRVAVGTPNSLGVTVYGATGHVSFDSLRSGEFHVFTADAAATFTNGPRRVFTGPQHPHFADVAPMPGAGVGTGYGEAFVAEMQDFLRAVLARRPMSTTFDTAVQTMSLIEQAQQIAAARL